MGKTSVSVVFNRKKTIEKKGDAAIEFYIYLSRKQTRYITYQVCTERAWRTIQRSRELNAKKTMYENIIQSMIDDGIELTIENFNHRIGAAPTDSYRVFKRKQYQESETGFIEFILDEMSKENLAPRSQQRIRTTIDAMARYGYLSSFLDLTDDNVYGFDQFLVEEDPSRTVSCRYNYHKYIKKYCIKAKLLKLIPENPYESALCRFGKGETKERRPLTEEEIVLLRDMDNLPLSEEHARDLFIFSAYTGLAYADAQAFDFQTMTEKAETFYFIKGDRIKTGSTFFTPILPPAMKILKKYDYKLPRMSNQKLNMYLHVLQDHAGITKPITSHIARHSFATLCLAHDIPMEDVQRMLGHESINTTRTYAKILSMTVVRHANKLAANLL